MKCFVCGQGMRLATVEPHDEAAMSGFEYRTFKCEGCGDTERRFALDLRAPLGPRPTESSRLEVKPSPDRAGRTSPAAPATGVGC
jgi:hypothetical protein